MGIRVHKAVGYGIRGITAVPYNIEGLNSTSIGGFVKWCETPNHREKLDAMVPQSDKFRHAMLRVDLSNAKNKTGNMYGHVLYDNSDNGMKDTLLFIPMGLDGDWYRYDSAIDFAEETRFHNQESRYEPIEAALYPFDRKRPPMTVAAMCLFLKMPELFKQLEEALYVYWS